MEILTGDDVGGGLRPIHGDFDIALFKDDRSLVVSDGGGAGLPLDIVVRRFAGLLTGGEVAGEGNPGTIELLLLCFQHFHLGTEVYGKLSHGDLLFLLSRIRNDAPTYSVSSRILSIYSAIAYEQPDLWRFLFKRRWASTSDHIAV